MSTRKHEKEQRREERLEAERREAAESRRRLVVFYAAAGLIAAVVVAGIVVAFLSGGDGEQVDSGDVPEQAHVDLNSGTVPKGAELDGREGTPPPALAQADLQAASKAAGCELQLDLPDEGAIHLAPGEEPPKYGTSPPTSGNHDPDPAADGAYSSAIEAPNFLHSMEHGRVAVLYDPELPEADQLALKGVFDEDPAGMLIFPYPDMPYEVAAIAWTELVGCDSYSPEAIDAIRDFRDQYRGQGPEDVPL